MVLLPVANMNEQAKECKKRGVPVPSEEDMVAAGREAGGFLRTSTRLKLDLRESA
jgi:hypothetical protein